MQVIEQKLEVLEPLAKRLTALDSAAERGELLASTPQVEEFLSRHPDLIVQLPQLSDEERCVLFAMICMGEADRFSAIFKEPQNLPKFHRLLRSLIDTEQFYSSLGGIVGYHATFLRLLLEEETPPEHPTHYLTPPVTDLTRETPEIKRFIFSGIENLGRTAFIFPVGGAGDRLNLVDPLTKEPLPAAKLNFGGQSLLEILFEYVQGLEYLHYKLFGKQVSVPIALMASQEKSNYEHITSICDHHFWFHRDVKNILFCTQPLSPVITVEGSWAFRTPFELHMKPGGHGVIWKLAIEAKIFEAFKKQGVSKALVRQINNPVASLDHTLLTLLGNAFDGHHDFGFVSCERPVNVAEGVLVLKKEKKSEGDCYTITNIEYTDFVHKGIEDVGDPYSQYPANTNILAVDLKTVEELIKGHPFPGMLVNPKALFEVVEPDGVTREVFGGRLETTMQNVADELHTFVPEGKEPSLRTFVCHGKRHKTLATTKRTLKEGKGPEQTAEKAFYDRLQCHWELFSDRCGMQLDPLCSFEEFLQAGPNYLIHYVPALGPLYSVIAQKIRGGTLSEGSELRLKIAELDVENLALEGSLLIDSHNALGSIGDNGLLHYGENVGRCTLRNVTIENRGINRFSAVNYWQNEFAHTERCVIVLHGNAEFYAEDVVIRGNQTFDVPAGHKMTLTASGKRLEPLEKPSWRWRYSRGSDSAIVLKRE